MTPTPDISPLKDLSHHRYALPALAELGGRRGAKVITLANALDAPRASVERSLGLLAELGYAARNPGYGHPMRPEFVLTDRGALAAPSARRIVNAAGRIDPTGALALKWSLPIVFATHPRPRGFADVRAALASATDRAISLTLKRLVGDRIVTRQLEDDYPPRSLYALEPRARALHAPLREIVSLG